MKSLFILATILSLSTLCFADTVEVPACSIVNINDVALFDICAFNNSGYQTVEFTSGALTYTVDWSLVVPQAVPCSGSGQVFATLEEDIAGVPTDCDTLSVSAAPAITALDSSDEEAGLTFTFPNNGTANKTLVINLSCNSTANATNEPYTATMNATAVIVTGSSSAACPTVSLSMLTDFLTKYKIVFLVIFFILGIFICFFGFQTLKVTIFIIAAIAGTFVCAAIFFAFTHLDTKKWVLWVIFVVCIIIGLVIGYLAVKFETLGFIALGIVLGGVGGLFLFNLVLAPFVQGKEYVLYIVVAILAIIGGLVAWKVWKKVVVIGTAVIGSYMMVRSISVVIGGFPSEGSIAAGVAKFSGVTYAYLVVMVLLAIAGAWVQFKRQGDDTEEDEQNAYERVMKGGNTGYGQNYGGGY